MNHSFLSNCIGLVRFHWRTEKSRCLRLFMMLFSIFLFKLIIVNFIAVRMMDLSAFSVIAAIFNEEWIYWGFILISVSYLFAAVHQKQRAIDYLSLPADPAEKYVTRLILGTIAIAVIAFTARMAANLIMITLVGILDSLAGNHPDWMQLYQYFGMPRYWRLAGIFTGQMTLSGFFLSFLLINTIALWPLSLFTLFGLWFRKMGWVYALATLFVGVFILYLLFETGLTDGIHLDRKTLQTSFLIYCFFFSLVHYLLAYRSFRHSQIVSSKRLNL